MNWLTTSIEEHSILWVLLSAFVGAIVGSAVRFAFEDILRPVLGDRRASQRLIREFQIPLLRLADSLERQINTHVRNIDRDWYETADHYRLGLLYGFAEYIAWLRLLEKRYGYTAVESSSAGRRFNRGTRGIYKALSSFTYFHKCGNLDAIDNSQVPRRMFLAMGDSMLDANDRVLNFAEFCVAYEKEPQFRNWFSFLSRVLARARPSDSESTESFCWDRLIAAGANLRAFAIDLDSKKRLTGHQRIVNLERIVHPSVRLSLERDLNPNKKGVNSFS